MLLFDHFDLVYVTEAKSTKLNFKKHGGEIYRNKMSTHSSSPACW